MQLEGKVLLSRGFERAAETGDILTESAGRSILGRRQSSYISRAREGFKYDMLRDTYAQNETQLPEH